MHARRWLAGLAFSLVPLGVAHGSGGTVIPATTGFLDYVYSIQAPSGGNDRAITRYGTAGVPAPNGTEFLCPNTVICGARTRSGHQAVTSANRPELLDIRLEDPNNPGFPNVVPVPAATGNLTPGTPAIAADSNATPAQCPAALAYQNYTFNNGTGVADPLSAVFLTWRFSGTTTPCLLALETRAPNNTRALLYNSLTAQYGGGPGNHWLEIVTFCPAVLTLSMRMHGSSQYPADPGLADWFIRADEAGTILDDYVSTTIVVDNGTSAPITNETLRLMADPSVINPKLAPRDVANVFRLIGSPGVSLASGNPYSWPPGRTVFRANVPAAVSAKFQAAMPVNVPFIASSAPPGPGPAGSAPGVLGARRQRGQIDDGTAELASIVQNPGLTGDALAQRFPALRFFPTTGGTRVTRVDVTRIDVSALSIGTGRGFDAIQLRRGDPVLLNSADISPQGLLGGIGTVGDAVVDAAIPVDPNGCRFYSFPTIPAIAAPSTDDVWAMVSIMPGDSITSGTGLCGDSTAATVLGQSYTSPGGVTPFTPSPTLNWMVRLISLPVPFAGRPAPDRPTMGGNVRLPITVYGQVPVMYLK
ncbi:MAG: hypothetical protein HYR85_07710 [Planctomycetes bacterium]|nr:hypothetical protein [Planctomycetota bacterium]MBI3843839.1 hypothetical protein [Planctomycetota bacterium]